MKGDLGVTSAEPLLSHGRVVGERVLPEVR